MALNVNRDVQDAFYRYKMPRLVTKVEGKGNGIKTVLPNMPEIAKALGRPPTYCTKYFGCELGAQTQFDIKNDRYVVNGSHEASKLQDLLHDFIKKFVLCEVCGNPETVLKVRAKAAMISSTCKACGHNFNLDMRHKVTTFILRNPPPNSATDQDASPSQKKDKQKKQKGKDDAAKEKKVTTKNKKAKEESNEEEEEVEWFTDVSEKAVEDRRIQELSTRVKAMTMDNDMEKSENERLEIFRQYVQTKKKNVVCFNDTEEKEIWNEAQRLEIGSKATKVLCQTILEASQNIVNTIKENRNFFLRFTQNNRKGQRYMIGGIESLVAENENILLQEVCKIFHVLYETDIVDEEVMIDWDKDLKKWTKHVAKDVADKIHQKCEPLLIWLQEAEEESEESEEDEVKIAFDERVRSSGIKEEKDQLQNGKMKDAPESNSLKKEELEDESDLDIDDI